MPIMPVIVTDSAGHPTASLTDCKLDLSYGRGDNAGKFACARVLASGCKAPNTGASWIT